ncbi:unnamed protein product [Chondrus crispus]|uniref:Uncharacterized protein n=1 Tax=Chondrus crispus TaxID=2769 RepID=R7QPT6_CHOCR|nr:unnamed protein product [Chondrus crispus]CDF40124.1 unnamed protein product [Chondrus crispus]|eukprot:XP_005710418.1 unnamed protein product [Chondrus crispus]
MLKGIKALYCAVSIIFPKKSARDTARCISAQLTLQAVAVDVHNLRRIANTINIPHVPLRLLTDLHLHSPTFTTISLQ